MAIAVVSTANSSNSEFDRHDIVMPDYIAAGNMLIAFFTCNGSGVSVEIDRTLSGFNWNTLDEYVSSMANTAVCYCKIADGNDTLRINTASAVTSTAIVYNLSGISNTTPIISEGFANSSNANPTSVTTASGTHEYIFVVYAGITGTVVASAAPTSFINLITQQSDINGSSSSAAHRLYTTTGAYDPGPFTSSAANYITFTVCVAPSGAAGIGITSLFYRS